MKKSIITLLVGTTIILTSCGDAFKGGWNINSAEGLKELKTEFVENFGGEMEIYQFEIKAKDHMTSEFGYAEIKYLEDNINFSREYEGEVTSGEKLQEPVKASAAFQKEFFLKQMQGKMKVKDLDFEKLIAKYNEACALIPTEYHNFTLYSWKYEMSSKNELTADFTIEGTKKGEGTTTEGRNIVTTYYEFKFEMDKNGEIEIKD